MSLSAAMPQEPSSKAEPGAHWKEKKEQHIIPRNCLRIVFLGLMCCTFLAALAQTIVANALPTIVAELDGGKSYSWVGSAYALGAASLGPLYGKLSDVLGRKPTLYGCIVIFLAGSALCGAAQSMTWLVVCRAVQGIGGGAIFPLVQTTISDMVSPGDRGKYLGALGATWGIANVVGPLLGGVLTDRVSWRWCFWINLPSGGLAGVVLFFFLNLNPHQGKSFRDHVKEFDFVGLATAVSGVVCLLLGLNSGKTTWKSVETISLLVIGGILLVGFAINEMYTKRSAIVPPRLFKTRTAGLILLSTFLHGFVFVTGSYYLPVYYQVLGASPTMSGVKLLPYTLSGSMQSALSGMLMARTGSYRPIMWGAWVVMTIGWSLMTMLDSASSIVTQEIYPVVAALGIGCLFQVPLIAIQAAMPLKDVATSTGAFVFLRTLGVTIGVTMGEVIISSTLQQRLRGIGVLTINTSAASINNNIRKIASISGSTLRAEVMQAYARSISTIWLVNAPLSALGLALVISIRAYPPHRTVIHQGEAEKKASVEAGSTEVEKVAVKNDSGEQTLSNVGGDPLHRRQVHKNNGHDSTPE